MYRQTADAASVTTVFFTPSGKNTKTQIKPFGYRSRQYAGRCLYCSTVSAKPATGTAPLPAAAALFPNCCKPYWHTLFPPPPAQKHRPRFVFLDWLQGYLKNSETNALLLENSYTPADIVRTLNALTAQSIADAIAAHAPGVREVFACGGVFNAVLMAELSDRLAPLGIRTATTDELNLPPQWVEAAAFAWLAACRVCREPGNPHAAAGAKQPYILGAWHGA